ncbi:MAG: N-acetyltransferase family protein [Actinomycetota bacterium]
MLIRPAEPAVDAAEVAAIYRPVVTDTHISFEEEAPDSHEMQRRMEATLAHTPWLVAEEDGAVGGYAYAVPHRERAAYRWSVDISVYLAAELRGRRVGRLLYDRLLPIIERQGFVNVYAGVALPNPASEALHRSIGMEPVGTYRAVGYKRGSWWDVTWYGMRLAHPQDPPPEPTPFPLLEG